MKLRIWIGEYYGFVVVGSALAALILAIAYHFPGPHRHEAYLTAKVHGVTQTGSYRPFLQFRVVLPDGKSLHLNTSRGIIFGDMIDTACVERRRYLVSGKHRHRLVPSQFCKVP